MSVIVKTRSDKAKPQLCSKRTATESVAGRHVSAQCRRGYGFKVDKRSAYTSGSIDPHDFSKFMSVRNVEDTRSNCRVCLCACVFDCDDNGVFIACEDLGGRFDFSFPACTFSLK